MRTALVLLLLLALAAVAGSLVPQVGVADARIAATFRDHPLRAEIYGRLGLFDVYGSWWFTLIYSLLLASMVGCLVPRTRALIRNLRQRPQPTRELDAMRHYVERSVLADPNRAITRARRVLRRRLFRVAQSNGGGPPSLAADKGLAREAGSLVFHWSFLLLLVGIIWGKGTGFTGQTAIVEGTSWTLAGANLDGSAREGRFFAGDYPNVRIEVESFDAAYRPTGQPKDFVTHADLYGDDQVVEHADIRVNHPVEIEGVKFYEFAYGWAPVIEVRSDGTPIASGPVMCRQDPPPKGVSPLQMPWTCVVKLPSLRPQVGIEFQLWPDSRALFALLQTGRAMPMVTEFAPVMTYTTYRGDLGLAVPQSVSRLDKTGLVEWTTGVVGAGQTVDLRTGEVLPDDATSNRGLTVSFPDLRQYTVLLLSRDRGLPIVLAAAVLILVSLLPALYSSRRKVWVTAEPDGAGSVLRVGGFALQGGSRFEEEFSRLVDQMATAPREEAGTR